MHLMAAVESSADVRFKEWEGSAPEVVTLNATLEPSGERKDIALQVTVFVCLPSGVCEVRHVRRLVSLVPGSAGDCHITKPGDTVSISLTV